MYIYLYICACVCVYMYVCACLWMCMHVYLCMCVLFYCMCVCVHVCFCSCVCCAVAHVFVCGDQSRQVSSLTTLIPWGRLFSGRPKLFSLGRLAGKGASEYWSTDVTPVTCFAFAGCWRSKLRTSHFPWTTSPAYDTDSINPFYRRELNSEQFGAGLVGKTILDTHLGLRTLLPGSLASKPHDLSGLGQKGGIKTAWDPAPPSRSLWPDSANYPTKDVFQIGRRVFWNRKGQVLTETALSFLQGGKKWTIPTADPTGLSWRKEAGMGRRQ